MQPFHSALARDQFATNYPREYRLFWAIDDDGDGRVQKRDVARVLESNGLTRKDRRLGELFSRLDECEVEALDFPAFLNIIQTVGTLFERTQQGDLVLPDFAQFSDHLAELFLEVERNQDGTQATYIPPLAEVDPEQFAMAVMTTDGQLLELGKTDTDFSVQSACKPFNYCFALDEHGEDKVHRHIGM